MEEQSLIDLIASVGEADFPAQALAFVNSRLVADHLSLFVFDPALVPRWVGGASRTSAKTAVLAGQIYEREMFYRFDPSSERVRRSTGTEDVVLFTLSESEISDPSYRSSIYARFGIIERVSLIRRVQGRWLLLNVYRDRGSGRFESSALTELAAIAALLMACAGKHIAQTAKSATGMRQRSGSTRRGQTDAVASFEHMLQSLNAGLTRRELQVCAHALAGITVAGIAATLGVKDSTVATLRRRAYAKLGVVSLSALFARCIAQLNGT